MKEAVIVSTARTPIGKAFRGAFNNMKSPTLMGHAIHHAVDRAGIDGGEIDDVVIGTVLGAGTAGLNVARLSALAAGLPTTVSGQTIDRQCASGLAAIATAAKQVVVDNMDCVAAGGQENITAGQMKYFEWMEAEKDANVIAAMDTAYMPMLETAEFVINKYNVSREDQDAYALQSQQRTAAGQESGKFDDEIVPLTSVQLVKDRDTGEVSEVTVTLERDEGNRPSTTEESLQSLNPVLEGGCVTAGNASQLSDGASACVIMDSKAAERKGLAPLGIYRGMAVAGVAPEEMGIGPVYAVPKLLEQHGLKVGDIGLWELNEAFACQALYCRDQLGIDPDLYNVNGGGISVGHPYGMTGARLVGHALIEGKRRNTKYVVIEKVMARLANGMGRSLGNLPDVTVISQDEIVWQIDSLAFDSTSVITAETRTALVEKLELDVLVFVELEHLQARTTPMAPTPYGLSSDPGLDLSVDIKVSLVNLHTGRIWQQNGQQRDWQPVRLQLFGSNQGERQLLMALSGPLEQFLRRVAPPPRIQERHFELSGD